MPEDRSKGASSRPSNDVLVAVVAELGAFDDPELVLEAVAAAGEFYPDAAARKAIIDTLGDQEPTGSIARYLKRREADEVPQLQSSATSALDKIAAKLDRLAENEDSHIADPGLAILADVRPQMALPHAQLRLDSPDPETRRVAAMVLGAHGTSSHVAALEAVAVNEPDVATRDAFHGAIRRLSVGDLAAAHEQLGQMASLAGPAWNAVNAEDLYGSVGPVVVAGLDRVVSNRTSGQWGTAIDQLSEVAKYLLFRTIEAAGQSIGLKADYVARVAANSIEYGSVLGNA